MTTSSTDTAAVRPRFGGLYRSLIINVGLPFVVVQVLLRNGTPPVRALAIAAVFPFVDALVGIIRQRRFDPIAVLSLLVIIIGIGTSGISGNPAFAIAKESLFTGVFGIVFLGSLFAKRPMIFTLGKQFSTGGDPAAIAAWDARWENPGFRRVIRRMTAVWGVGFLLEAIVRVIVAFALPVSFSTVVSPLLGVVVIVGLIVWTTAYIRAIRRRLAAAAEAA
jgi:intracellular septation protein A